MSKYFKVFLYDITLISVNNLKKNISHNYFY